MTRHTTKKLKVTTWEEWMAKKAREHAPLKPTTQVSCGDNLYSIAQGT